ncbi:MAG: hypothetical protein V2B20_28890, partial [Pseudomonadota bacterium]
GQQRRFTEVAAWADMTDRVLTASLDIYRQFRLTLGDDVKMVMVFTLPVNVLALFDYSPFTGGYNLFYRIALDVFEKDGLVQVLYECFVVEHRSMKNGG